MSPCLYLNLPPWAFWRKYDGWLGRMSTPRISWMFIPRVFNSSTILIPKNPAAPVTTTISPFSPEEAELRAIVLIANLSIKVVHCSRSALTEGRLQGSMFTTPCKVRLKPAADGSVDSDATEPSNSAFTLQISAEMCEKITWRDTEAL